MPHFNGAEYDPALDDARLTKQIGRVFAAIRDGHWMTLCEIAAKTHDPEASVSAQLRHLRKPRFGEYVILKRRRGNRAGGLFEYRCCGPVVRPVGQADLFGASRVRRVKS